ncbi:peptide chain release factor family protein [Nocardia sp. NPDC049149]|uniref:peptide chain release factor family protein n=1 Tax=Nocardia sp. NPDC049149 TaxID=3364315 RepID=UPI003718F8AC
MSDDLEFRCDVYTTAVPVTSPGYRCTARVVHLPTGLVASCSDTKSAVVNRKRAMMELRARLLQRAGASAEELTP